MVYFGEKVGVVLYIALCLTVSSTFAQSSANSTRCNSACANDLSCSSNQCSLASCSDTGSCFQYCLQCNDITTCYATGTTCYFTSGLQTTNISNQTKYSIYLTVFSFLLFYVSKWFELKWKNFLQENFRKIRQLFVKRVFEKLNNWKHDVLKKFL